MSLRETAGKLRGGTLRARDLVEQCLARIDEWQPITNAFIEVDADGARRSADAADADLRRGVDRGVLHGVPIALKDLLDQQGHVTTAGSRSMTTVAAADAPAVTHLRGQGAVFIGRTNMHEFALGTTSEDSGFGPVRHPLNHLHSAGGSSGGSAVAVSTGMSAVAIGSDTGGSIRIPSAACGLVGLKPAWGEVSLSGVVPLSPTVDCVGPLATSVEDAWYSLQGLRHAGALPECPAARGMHGLRIGVLRDLGWRRVADAIGGQLNDAIGWLARGGAVVEDVSMATTPLIAPTYSTIVMREAIDFHTPRLPAHAADYTPAVRGRLQTAPRPSDEEYAAAMRRACPHRSRCRRAARAGRHPGAARTVDHAAAPRPVHPDLARWRPTHTRRHAALHAAVQSLAASGHRAARGDDARRLVGEPATRRPRHVVTGRRRPRRRSGPGRALVVPEETHGVGPL